MIRQIGFYHSGSLIHDCLFLAFLRYNLAIGFTLLSLRSPPKKKYGEKNACPLSGKLAKVPDATYFGYCGYGRNYLANERCISKRWSHIRILVEFPVSLNF